VIKDQVASQPTDKEWMIYIFSFIRPDQKQQIKYNKPTPKIVSITNI
jgi:hypothetical protein